MDAGSPDSSIKTNKEKPKLNKGAVCALACFIICG